MQINYLCKVILKTLGIFYNGAKKADILLQNVTENYHLNAVWTHVECDMTCSTILQPQPSDTLELHDIMRHLQCFVNTTSSYRSPFKCNCCENAHVILALQFNY